MKDWKTGETKDQEIIDDALQAAWTNGVLEAAEPIEEGEERVSVDGNAVLEALAHPLPTEPGETFIFQELSDEFYPPKQPEK